MLLPTLAAPNRRLPGRDMGRGLGVCNPCGGMSHPLAPGGGDTPSIRGEGRPLPVPLIKASPKMTTYKVYFTGYELKGVHCGWRTVRVLREGRKWVLVEINGTRHRLRKEAWGELARRATTVSPEPEPKASTPVRDRGSSRARKRKDGEKHNQRSGRSSSVRTGSARVAKL